MRSRKIGEGSPLRTAAPSTSAASAEAFVVVLLYAQIVVAAHAATRIGTPATISDALRIFTRRFDFLFLFSETIIETIYPQKIASLEQRVPLPQLHRDGRRQADWGCRRDRLSQPLRPTGPHPKRPGCLPQNSRQSFVRWRVPQPGHSHFRCGPRQRIEALPGGTSCC